MTDLYSKEEDHGYRRGFDQGVATLAYALGIPNSQLQQAAFKQRCTAFRHGRIKEAPGPATEAEAREQKRISREPTEQEKKSMAQVKKYRGSLDGPKSKISPRVKRSKYRQSAY